MIDSRDYIGRRVDIKIDRPIGSRHPRHEDTLYGVNYGYVPGTTSYDGEELDAYLLGVKEAVTEFTGICVAVIRRKEESDDKLVVIPSDCERPSREAIRRATDFQERYFDSELHFE